MFFSGFLSYRLLPNSPSKERPPLPAYFPVRFPVPCAFASNLYFVLYFPFPPCSLFLVYPLPLWIGHLFLLLPDASHLFLSSLLSSSFPFPSSCLHPSSSPSLLSFPGLETLPCYLYCRFSVLFHLPPSLNSLLSFFSLLPSLQLPSPPNPSLLSFPELDTLPYYQSYCFSVHCHLSPSFGSLLSFILLLSYCLLLSPPLLSFQGLETLFLLSVLSILCYLPPFLNSLLSFFYLLPSSLQSSPLLPLF